MILIADSGSTKTDWMVSSGEINKDKVISTQGINPFHQSENEIELILKNEVLPQIQSFLRETDVAKLINSIAFYGAGCIDTVTT